MCLLQLHGRSLHTAMALLGRYLRCSSQAPVTSSTLQQVGAACLLVACKLHETPYTLPSAWDLVWAAAGAYDRQQLLAQEVQLLQALEHRVLVPTIYDFLAPFLSSCKAAAASSVASYAAFCGDACLLSWHLQLYPCSLQAAAAVFVALAAHNASKGVACVGPFGRPALHKVVGLLVDMLLKLEEQVRVKAHLLERHPPAVAAVQVPASCCSTL